MIAIHTISIHHPASFPRREIPADIYGRVPGRDIEEHLYNNNLQRVILSTKVIKVTIRISYSIQQSAYSPSLQPLHIIIIIIIMTPLQPHYILHYLTTLNFITTSIVAITTTILIITHHLALSAPPTTHPSPPPYRTNHTAPYHIPPYPTVPYLISQCGENPPEATVRVHDTCHVM